MNTNSNKISFEYSFTCGKDAISNKQRADTAAIIAVDALFTIRINEVIFFQAELAIFEFYKALLSWKEKKTEKHVPDFHYYTIEYDEYEEGALISIIQSSQQALVKSIWAEIEGDYLFDLSTTIGQLMRLEEDLRKDLEAYFEINLKGFIPHIPYSECE